MSGVESPRAGKSMQMQMGPSFISSAAARAGRAFRVVVVAVARGERELVLAEGREAEVVRLRRSDPDKLFDLAAKMIADGYAQQLGATKPKA